MSEHKLKFIGKSKKDKKAEEHKKSCSRKLNMDDDHDIDGFPTDEDDDDSNFETIDSDDEDDEEEDEEEEEEEEEDDEDLCSEDSDDSELKNVIKLHKLHKFVSKLYPSKYSSSKVKNDKKHIKLLKGKDKKRRHDEDEDDEDEDDEDEEYNEQEKHKKFNIIFNIGEANGDYNSEYESESKSDLDEKKEGEEDEKVFMKELYHPSPSHLILKEQEKKSLKKEKEKEKKEPIDVKEEYTQLVEIKRDVLEKLEKNPTNKYYIKMLKSVKEDIENLIKTGRKQNAKQFYKLINAEHKKKSELEYFEKQLSHREQLKIVEELKAINECLYIDKPYRLSVLQSSMPEKVKAIALQRLNSIRQMEAGDPEYFKLKNWVDSFLKIPFGTYKNLPISIEDGVDKCHEFMENAYQTLNSCTYGMNDTKMQVMQLLGQWLTNPEAIGNSLSLCGPPGIGKTSLVKNGISKILGRDFIFISLGGSGDGSFLEGNSYVYEGSSYGKIIQSIIQCGSMNPIIYFDELDKVSDSSKGQEIIGILTHLIDSSQNTQFHDKYFSEIDFDLSKCLFVFSYNDESLVNPILRDRMYKLKLDGYNTKDKVSIGQNYLIPTIQEQVKFSKEDIVFTPEIMSYIIENFTQKEEGVRNLKRCLEIIYTKLNMFRLMKTGTDNFFSTAVKLDIKFPHTLTKSDVDVLIKDSNKKELSGLSLMYI